MSRSSIRKQIIKYKALRAEAEEELRKYKEELENLLTFKSRYNIGKEDFDNNINHRKTRAENVNAMSKKIKSGRAYYAGMYEDLTGTRYQEAINNAYSITDKINKIIIWLEEEIKELKQKIAHYNDRIEELYEHLSREHDD